jgi:hypothetical protein
MLLKPACECEQGEPVGRDAKGTRESTSPAKIARQKLKEETTHVLNEISTNRMTCASSKTSGIPLRVSRRRKDYTVPQKMSKNDIISQAVIA